MSVRAFILGTVLTATAGVALAAPPLAEIVKLDGKGQYSVDQQATWRPASVKLALPPLTYVRTLDLSKMAILLPDRSQMDLGPNGLAQIMGPDDTATIRLQAGRAWGQAKAPPKRLIIETPAALAAIRGTDWEIAVDDDGRATLSVFSGEVEFYNDQGNVLVRSNEQARAEKGRAPVKLQLVVSRAHPVGVVVQDRSDCHANAGAPAELAAIVKQIREQDPRLTRD
jgi:hypothetical protein